MATNMKAKITLVKNPLKSESGNTLLAFATLNVAGCNIPDFKLFKGNDGKISLRAPSSEKRRNGEPVIDEDGKQVYRTHFWTDGDTIKNQVTEVILTAYSAELARSNAEAAVKEHSETESA